MREIARGRLPWRQYGGPWSPVEIRGRKTRESTGTKHGLRNSSTSIGPKGLASNSDRRRCRTANEPRQWVRGAFHVLAPEIIGFNRWKLARPGGRSRCAWDPEGNTS